MSVCRKTKFCIPPVEGKEVLLYTELLVTKVVKSMTMVSWMFVWKEPGFQDSGGDP